MDPMSMIESRPLRIRAADGYELAAHVFEPVRSSVVRNVLIAPATGAKASYYHRFAAFLAQRGFRALVADYRGVAASAPPDATGRRRVHARWHEWATLDLEAQLAWFDEHHPDDELVGVGHSFGGFGIPLAPRAERMTRLLTVGAQHAYWRDFAPAHRLSMVVQWRAVMPIITAVVGYFPGDRLGWLDSIPRGVVWDWAKSRADFTRTIGRDGPRIMATAARFPGTVLAVAPDDDEFATAFACERALGYLSSAQTAHRTITRAELGVDHIRHLGLFHARFSDTFWPASAAWLGGEPFPDALVSARGSAAGS